MFTGLTLFAVYSTLLTFLTSTVGVYGYGGASNIDTIAGFRGIKYNNISYSNIDAGAGAGAGATSNPGALVDPDHKPGDLYSSVNGNQYESKSKKKQKQDQDRAIYTRYTDTTTATNVNKDERSKSNGIFTSDMLSGYDSLTDFFDDEPRVIWIAKSGLPKPGTIYHRENKNTMLKRDGKSLDLGHGLGLGFGMKSGQAIGTSLVRRAPSTSGYYSYSQSSESSYTGSTQSYSTTKASSSTSYRYRQKSYTGVTCSAQLKIGGASNVRYGKSNSANVSIYGRSQHVFQYGQGVNRRVVSTRYVRVNPYMYQNYGGQVYRYVNQNKYRIRQGNIYTAYRRSGNRNHYRRVSSAGGNYRVVNGYVYTRGNQNRYHIQNRQVMRRINDYAPVTGNVQAQGIMKGYISGYIGGRRVYRQRCNAAIKGKLDENGSLNGNMTLKLNSGTIIQGSCDGKVNNMQRARMYNYSYGYRQGRRSGYYRGYRRGYYNRRNGINRGAYRSGYPVTVVSGGSYSSNGTKTPSYTRYGYRNRYYNARRVTSRYRQGYQTTRRYMNKYEAPNRVQVYGGYRAGYRALTNYARGTPGINKSTIVGPYKTGYQELKSYLSRNSVPGKDQILANYINNYRAIYRYVYRREIYKKYKLVNGYNLGYSVGFKKAYISGYKKGSAPGAPTPSGEPISSRSTAPPPSPPASSSSGGECSGLHFKCVGTGSTNYYECVNGSFLERQCGPGVFCYPYVNNPKTILCGFKQ